MTNISKNLLENLRIGLNVYETKILYKKITTTTKKTYIKAASIALS